MIPVYEPLIGDEELANVVDCIRRGVISGVVRGDYIDRFEDLVAASCGAQYGIATTSGTTALALAVAALGIGASDEVIVPSFTNIATAFAVIYSGAKPIFVDVDPATWNIDADLVAAEITPKTKAILPVHIYGQPADMDRITEVAQRHGLLVIEDACEAHGAEYKGRPIGAIGDAGCLSFFANKVITTGEGGMVVSNDECVARRARSLKNLSYSTEEKFKHVALGFNYRMTNIQAAIGVAQMKSLPAVLERKRQIAHAYEERLQGVEGLQLPTEAAFCTNIYWVYGVVVGGGRPRRHMVVERLAAEGIETRPFFYPLHRQPVFREMGIVGERQLRVSEYLGEGGFYLPSGPGLTETQIDIVCDALRNALDAV